MKMQLGCSAKEHPSFRMLKKPPTGKMQRIEHRTRKITFRRSLSRMIYFFDRQQLGCSTKEQPSSFYQIFMLMPLADRAAMMPSVTL